MELSGQATEMGGQTGVGGKKELGALELSSLASSDKGSLGGD